MQDLKVSLVQTNQYWENKEENLSNYEGLLEGVNADLILLPEMFHTGFTLNAQALAEKYNNSQGIKWLQQMAKAKNAAIYTSLIIEENNRFFNRGVFVYPNKTIFNYDKRKSFTLAGENEIFKEGLKETIVAYKGWKIQLQICYDLRFPELVRNYIGPDRQPKYDLILYVANWPKKRRNHWITLLKARAIENQCYVVGVNRIGEDGNNLLYSGDSLIADAMGRVVNEIENIESVDTSILSGNELINVRKNLPFLKDQ